MNFYRICFKGGTIVDVKATKLELGRIFTKASIVLTREGGNVEEQAYLPIDEILYVLPLEVITFEEYVSSGESQYPNPILDS